MNWNIVFGISSMMLSCIPGVWGYGTCLNGDIKRGIPSVILGLLLIALGLFFFNKVFK